MFVLLFELISCFDYGLYLRERFDKSGIVFFDPFSFPEANIDV